MTAMLDFRLMALSAFVVLVDSHGGRLSLRDGNRLGGEEMHPSSSMDTLRIAGHHSLIEATVTTASSPFQSPQTVGLVGVRIDTWNLECASPRAGRMRRLSVAAWPRSTLTYTRA